MPPNETEPAAPSPNGDATLLAAFLANHDAPCPVCAYNLRGLDRARCPECGAALDLRIGSDDLRMGPWIMTLLAYAMPLGFFGTYMVFQGLILIVQIVVGRTQFGDEIAMFYGVCAAIAMIYLSLIRRLIRGRSAFLNKARAAQIHSAWRAWVWCMLTTFMVFVLLGWISVN